MTPSKQGVQVYFHTLGCRVNQYETELIREKLQRLGYVPVAAHAEADLCVINTCTVTEEADKDARRLIRKITKDNPAAQIAVTGCYATRAPQDILAAAPNAWVFDNSQKETLAGLADDRLTAQTAPKNQPLQAVANPIRPDRVCDSEASAASGGCRLITDAPGFIKTFSGHTRAFVKIQDGCNMSCTYCIIPTVRPTLWHKPFATVIQEVRTLLENGYKEIVLCGIRLGRYLNDSSNGRSGTARVDFVKLLETLAQLQGDFRVRLSSLEITDVTDRFLSVFSENERFCPSLHLPLQSGDDGVLKLMKRWYTTAFYARRVEAAKKRIKDLGLFTDLMIGFPGETAQAFENSLRFAQSMEFAGMHLFRYSKRSGTPAAGYKNQVPEQEMRRRVQEIHALDRQLRKKFIQENIGSVRTVLVEEELPYNRTEGFTDNYIRIQLKEPAPHPGFFQVQLEDNLESLAKGRLMTVVH